MPITFKCIRFEALSLQELYDILALRNEVFIVEQNCPFQDIDSKDQMAWHCLGFDENQRIVAYTRLFEKGVYYDGFVSIGRVVTSPKARGGGLGKILVQKSIEYCQQLFGNESIKIGAQVYLLKFYESLGFQSIGQNYLEDGIEHTIMVKSKSF